MNADRIAAVYRWIEYAAFGRALERARFAFLDVTAKARRILILGEGDGRFLSQLLRTNPAAAVDVIDSSAAMLSLARQRIAALPHQNVRFHQADVLRGSVPAGTYDLIVTNFFLDCLTGDETANLIDRLESTLVPGGFWIVGEFQEPPRGLRRWHARLWLFAMYRFFRLTTGLRPQRLPPYGALLRSVHLELLQERQARFGLITSQLWRKPMR